MVINSSWNCVGEYPADNAIAPIDWRLLNIDAGAICAVAFNDDARSFAIFYQGSPSRATLDHCLNDLVIPRLIALDGDLVLHAGAIVSDAGAICFLGPSRQGKSTLAGSFKSQGFPLISDDTVLLRRKENEWHAEQITSCLRLYPDSIEQLFPTASSLAPVTDYSNKRHLPFAMRPGSASLAALFRIAEPGDRIAVRHLTASEACMAIVANSFALNPNDPTETGQRFTKAAEVARDVPVYDLHYPRNYSELPAVHAAIFEALGLRLVMEPSA